MEETIPNLELCAEIDLGPEDIDICPQEQVLFVFTN